MPTIKLLILCITLMLVPPTLAQYGSCDYAQTLVVGRSYDVFSPNYGSNKPYLPGTMCRWRATSPVGTRITVSCTDIRLPYSQSCTGDRIEISYSGNPTLADAQRYCSNQPFAYQTSSNQIAISLKSAQYGGSGGYFLCKLSATGAPPAPAPVPQQPINSNNGQCGRRKVSRIVGGFSTLVNEFPMMAGLVDGYNPVVFCGAVIVSPYCAVTTVHCFNKKVVTNVKLLVGDHDYGTGYDTTYAATYPLRSALFHPAYSAQTDLNDIAIVTTVNMIQYNVAVGPVCLPYGNDQLLDQTVEAVGWGTTSFAGKPSAVLQKVPLRVISYQQCADFYGSRVAYSQICTLTPSRDACQMDSGGPLFLSSGGLVYLAGLISYGTGCAEGKPGVSTRITYYADWIRANMR